MKKLHCSLILCIWMILGANTFASQPFESFSTFKDCDHCPEMVVIPAGVFTMGSSDAEQQRADNEGPQRQVEIRKDFAIGKYELTFDEWDVCVSNGACDDVPSDHGWGRGSRPVIKVSWLNAKRYLDWLSDLTGHTYRLPSEAEWEYVARAGTSTPFSTGETITGDQANINGEHTYGGSAPSINRNQTIEVGSFAPNPFGVYDMHGNVIEWVEDCQNDSYEGAPGDATPWLSGDCTYRVLRGGHWGSRPGFARSAVRKFLWDYYLRATIGIRVARELQSP